LDRSVISHADAELARAEVARRLIRAARETDPASDVINEVTYRRRRAASAIILSTIPLVALSLYGAKGSPQMPAKPLAGRLSTDPANIDLAVALSRVETHLQLNPTDGRGWEILAPIYLRTGRYDDAARAYANAAIHLGSTMERLVDVGEARVLAASGVVTADARAAFVEAGKLGPLNPKGMYYLAIARDQDGDRAGAIADLKALLASAPPDAGWSEMVSERIAVLEGKPPPPPTGSDAVAGASVVSGTVVSAPGAAVASGVVSVGSAVVSSTTVVAGVSVPSAASSFLLQAPATSPPTTKVVSSSRLERPRVRPG
jgi:cytochrome c-type biogenesis protein CcmH